MGIETAKDLLNAFFFIPATSINTNYETWKDIKKKIYKEYNEINVKFFWLAFVFFSLVHRQKYRAEWSYSTQCFVMIMVFFKAEFVMENK